MAWQIVKDATIIHHLRHESALLWFYSIDIEHQKGVGVKTDDVFSRGWLIQQQSWSVCYESEREPEHHVSSRVL